MLAGRVRQIRHRALRVALDVRHRVARRILVARLPKHGVGAEIGVWKGDFSEWLLRGARPSRLHLIDPWQHRSGAAYRGAMFARKDDAQMDAVYRDVRERFAPQIARGEVVIHRAPSTVAVPELPRLDWAYIDGDHTYEGVLSDLRSCWERLAEGGCLAGDDYGVTGWWHDGVTKAVDEFAASVECAKTIVGTQFLLRKHAGDGHSERARALSTSLQ